jgi:uncharacterized protein (DUF2267 family)
MVASAKAPGSDTGAGHGTCTHMRAMTNVIEDITRRTGLEPSAAADALRGVIEVLASGLAQDARDDVLALLPAPVSGAAAAERAPLGASELYRRVGQALGAGQAESLEVAQVVCQAIHAHLSDEARARIARQLDPSLLELMVEAPTAAAPEPLHHLPGGGRTLATGRPGSAHPISESAPGSSRPLSGSKPDD